MQRFAAIVVLLLLTTAALASDHADPVILTDPNANITGLFFFPKGDNMIAILNVRRALTAPPPYDLDPYEYIINMDLHSKVSFDDPANNARYGGTVVNPGGIAPDVQIHLKLNNDTTLKSKVFTGLKNTDSIRIFTGVRDDPFIFPRFFKKNVISMVLSIPMNCFPDGQQDFLLWGESLAHGKHNDHVGRSNRTQLVRYSSVIVRHPFVNELPPSQHVSAIMDYEKGQEKTIAFLKKYTQTFQLYAGVYEPEIQMRKYDLAPDVMIYSKRNPAGADSGFPNGRRLPDDVAHITCEIGDCILQELSFIEGGWPRATKNDKEFLPDFPYLAEPWPNAPETPTTMKSIIPMVVFYLIIIVLIILAIGFWIGWAVGRRRHA
ncbi:MAG TPA: DUF4331 family protein [Thermoanaerobaculia bacterium]|nr:DUF4331 family protein [Thermoanaerobaculia bacterium]